MKLIYTGNFDKLKDFGFKKEPEKRLLLFIARRF